MDPSFSNLSEIWSVPMLGPGSGRLIGPSSGPGPARDDGGPRKRRENYDNVDGDDDESVAMEVCNGMSTSGCGEDDNEKMKGDVDAEQKNKPSVEPPKDYIHVRARRGQATDSHSLAERARREKISERMRILQDLVPGCNKVIGKALVLDEIINYVQSLQRQVEFLSMKLEAVNSGITPGIEAFHVKEFVQQAFDTSRAVYGSQSPPKGYNRDTSPEWLHMQIGGGFDR